MTYNFCKFKNLIFAILMCFCFIFSQENAYSYEQAYSQKLNNYLDQAKTAFKLEDLITEKYIIEIMRHVTEEIHIRFPDYSYTGNNYYQNLEKSFTEVKEIIERVKKFSDGSDLGEFANELKNQIDAAIKSPEIDKEKSAFFNRSINLLLVAEKALATGNESVINDTESKFTQLFNRASKQDTVAAKKMSIFDVMNNWESANILTNNQKIEKLIGYQVKLKNSAKPEEYVRLKRDLFQRAIIFFNENQFELALKLMQNLRSTYDVSSINDRLDLYMGLANYYLNKYEDAKVYFEKVLESKSSSQLVAISLFQIYQNLKQEAAIDALILKFANISTAQNKGNDFYFAAMKYYYNKENYQKALETVNNITGEYYLSNDVLYYKALITYASNKELAKANLLELKDKEDVHPELHNYILLKLSYIFYNEGKFSDAIYWLNEINGDEFPENEKVLLGKAWAYYEIESAKPDTTKKYFKETKFYINEFLKDYFASDYVNEAKALYGYVKQKSSNIPGAEKEFKDIFESKSYKLLSDKFLLELDSLQKVRSKVSKMEQTALFQKNYEAFKRLEDIAYELDKKIYKIKYMDVSSVNATVESDLSVILSQIDEFERLREKAVEKGDEKIIERIDFNLLKLYTIANTKNKDKKQSLFGVNFFKNHTLARKLSLIEHRNSTFKEMSVSTEKTYTLAKEKLESLKLSRVTAVEQNDVKKIANIDMAIYRLEKSLGKMDFFKSYSNDKADIKLGTDIDKWANYGAYQLTNIQYIQQKEIDEENDASYGTISKINNLMTQRNVIIAEQVKHIENRISLINRRVARERRIAEEKKKLEFFATEYFEDKTYEINEDSIRTSLENKSSNREKNRADLNVDSLKLDDLSTDSVSTDSLSTDSLSNDSTKQDQIPNKDEKSKESPAVNNKNNDAIKNDNDNDGQN